ncbi:protein FAN-like [Copidosoma floridanum]|uniref:protein FAN-like n=1 Tax=Copidosoma floridanum TaxID=29053 RepID=UPI0006C96279|nr:protein FAN-like [Copidosoma floridanum]
MATTKEIRFTMLLLDPGEIFFEDYSVQMKFIDGNIENDENQWLDGRLKLCSKSLVFVSKDINQPLIKIAHKDITSTEKLPWDNNLTEVNDALLVHCKQYVEMFKGNILAPYKFIHQPADFQFSFNYAKVEDCLPQILQLLRAATLPTAEQNAMIMAIVHSRQSRFTFDTSWLEDLYEQIIIETQANKVSPLVINPGRVLLTNCRIYFQPYNNMDQYPVLKINLKDIKNVIKRRFLLRQVGLEIKWSRPSDNKTELLFLSTKNQEDRDALYTSMLNQFDLKIETLHQNQMTMQWQNGSLSNYDYLLYINSIADRTFHDLTQYPVMPWVLQDYTSTTLDFDNPNIYRDLSKPIGALELKRLERLKDRYDEMSEPKFLYGSHYSAPGFVLFYLVRKYPQYMLCLQNGRFDHPDRMFNSLSDVWKNVLNNMSDFKELIPEFYDTSNNGDFLVNSYGIDFGYRHDGTKINDVHLPPWAKDPSDFVRKMRKVLESNWVSKNLHHWIDLIFGYKQKGEEAVKADNVFFHLCYEGAIDLDTIKDINDRHGLEVQIMEFGQIPKQIFKVPHPKRFVVADLIKSESLFSAQEHSSSPGIKMPNFKQRYVFQSHKESVSAVATISYDAQSEDVISVGRDGIMKIYSPQTGKLTRRIALSSVPLISCVSYQTPSKSNVIVVGTSDNYLIYYDVEFAKVFETLYAHNDAVSCLLYSKKHNVIASSSWDCTTKIWRPYSDRKMKLAESFVAELDHDAQVTCISMSKDETLLATGTEDGEVYLWNFGSYELRFTVKDHMSRVNSITFEPESNNIISCASNNSLIVMDVQTSTQIYFATLDEEPMSFGWIGSLLLIGDAQGDLHVWYPQTAAFISKFHCHEGAIVSVAITSDNKKVMTGGRDKKVIVWDCE